MRDADQVEDNMDSIATTTAATELERLTETGFRDSAIAGQTD